MNVNSKPKAPTNNWWLQDATEKLSSFGVLTPRLDAELLLAYQLQKSRTWIIAHHDGLIEDLNILESASKLLERRLMREPLAYITHNKEFYTRNFYVDKNVLIPRPESETIIDVLKECISVFEEDVAASQPSATGAKPRKAASENAETHSFKKRLLDIGTGSGCLGITAKLEFPQLSVTLSDISEDALNVARKNAKDLGAKPLRYVQSDLLEHWLAHKSPKKFDFIIANLPYVDRSWERSPETNFEPSLALFADDNGMTLIKKCIQQASKLTSVSGYLVLEADPEQHQTIISYASKHGFSHVRTDDYIVVLKRV